MILGGLATDFLELTLIDSQTMLRCGKTSSRPKTHQHRQGLRRLAVPDEPDHLQQRLDLGGHSMVGPGAVVELANGPLFFALAAVSRPPKPHRPHQEVRADFSRLDQLDEELAELLLLGLVFVPVILAFVLSGLLQNGSRTKFKFGGKFGL